MLFNHFNDFSNFSIQEEIDASQGSDTFGTFFLLDFQTTSRIFINKFSKLEYHLTGRKTQKFFLQRVYDFETLEFHNAS